VIGMVLAAGASRRLRPDTDALPKALLPVAGDTTILDITLRNLAAVGLREVVVVVGHAAGVIRDRAAALQRRHGVTVQLVHNERALDWNNAYSLWLAREYFAGGALLVNGDTVHPVSIEKTLLAAAGTGGEDGPGVTALVARVTGRCLGILRAVNRPTGQLETSFAQATPGALCDQIASAVVPDVAVRQALLEELDIERRLERLAGTLDDLYTQLTGER